MQDYVFIEGLTVYSQIGVYDWEQTLRQALVFDLEMHWDIRPAAKTDDVQYCLNYAQVSDFIIQFVSSRSFSLIETVAEQVAEQLMTQFHLSGLKLKLSKPRAVAQAQNVGVVIYRGNGFSQAV